MSDDPAKSEGFARDSDEARKGIGAYLTWVVLGLILLVCLTAAYSLHAFPWQ